MSHFFERLNPDRKNLLTLHAVVNIGRACRGAVVILAMILGLPSQIGTLIGLSEPVSLLHSRISSSAFSAGLR